MKKKIYWLWLLIPIFGLSQCNIASNKAIVHNNNIIQFQKNINNEISAFFKIFENSDSTGVDSALVVKAYDKLVLRVKHQVDSVKLLKPVDKDSTFKMTAIEFFVFYQKMIELDYARLIPFMMQKIITKEEQDAMKNMEDKNKKEQQVYYQKFKKAQVDFAKRHGFELSQ